MTRRTLLPCAFAAAWILPSIASAQELVWTHDWPGARRITVGTATDPAGDLLVIGTEVTQNFVPLGRFVRKLSTAGEAVWTFTAPPGPTWNSAWESWFAPNGDVLLVERGTTSPTVRIERIAGATGTSLWSRSITEPVSIAYLTALEATPNGEVTCLVGCLPPSSPYTRAAVLRFDAAGNLLWDTLATARPSVTMEDSLQVDVHGNAWYVDRNTSGEFRLVKIDNQGHIAWSVPYVDPRGPNESSLGLTVDAHGRAHWYVGLDSGPTTLPAVEAVIDTYGNLVAANDLPMNPQSFGFQQLGDRIAHAGKVLGGTDTVVQVRDKAGHLAWSATRPAPAGFAFEWTRSALDANGGDLQIFTWTSTQPGPPAIQVKVRYDASGHERWIDGPGFVPIGPDAGMVEWSPNSGSTLLTITRYGTRTGGFCYGDGSQTACPCGNASAPSQEAGCAHSLGYGAKLTASGEASLALDSLVLDVQGATGTTLLLAQGSAFQANGAGTVLGDGLQCLGGSRLRIATRALTGGALQFPQPGDGRLSTLGGVTSPGTRTYQAFFRDAASFCAPSTQGTTNGVYVRWVLF